MAKLILKEVGPNRSKVLFLLRDIFYLSLTEAKKLMDNAPVTLIDEIPKYTHSQQLRTVAQAKYWLKDAGATIEEEIDEVLDLNDIDPVIIPAYSRGEING